MEIFDENETLLDGTILIDSQLSKTAVHPK